MERAEWLKRMRSLAEALYDHAGPLYWASYGTYPNELHLEYLRKFLAQIPGPGAVLSAGCGAGRYDGYLLDAGHQVTGVDQSTGMLAKAREHFPVEQYPQLRYEKIGLQEIASHPEYHAAFDGVICLDALEHVSPEDYPAILRGLADALKPGGVLYITSEPAEGAEPGEVEGAYERAIAQGLPVVYGEIADQVESTWAKIEPIKGYIPDEVSDVAVYHYLPPLKQVQDWVRQAGLVILEEQSGKWYHHILARKPAA